MARETAAQKRQRLEAWRLREISRLALVMTLHGQGIDDFNPITFQRHQPHG